MSGCLIKERNVLENEFAAPDPFIDRWRATAQPTSFYIKMDEGDKGSVSRTGRDGYAHSGVQRSHPVIQLILTWALVIAPVTRSDCTLDRREIAVKGTRPPNRTRNEHPRRSGVAQKSFLFSLLSFLLKMRICMLMRSREQISLSYGPVRERCALNPGRGIMNAKSWRRFPLLLKERVPTLTFDNLWSKRSFSLQFWETFKCLTPVLFCVQI